MAYKNIDQVRKTINPTNTYNSASAKFMKTFMGKVKYRFMADEKNLPEDQKIINIFDVRSCALCGSTDYIDHSTDSNKTLKKLVEASIASMYSMQLGHLYNQDGSLVEEIIVSGRRGGWMCDFVYKNGKSFFNKK